MIFDTFEEHFEVRLEAHQEIVGFTCHDDLKLENREYNLKFISVQNF